MARGASRSDVRAGAPQQPLLEQLVDLVVGVGQRCDGGLAGHDVVHRRMHDAVDLRGVVGDREQERGLVLHIDEECA